MNTPTQAGGTPDQPPTNPLLEPWSGPFGGVPPFDRVRVEHFTPALAVAIEEAEAEIERIASRGEPSDFKNTIEALELSGALLERVRTLANIWRTAMSSPEFRAVEADMMVRIAAFEDRVTQNEPLFRRVEAVYRTSEAGGQDPERARLVWLHYTNFVRCGAALDAASKQRLTAINQRLAQLTTVFDQNVLADENEQFVLLENEADLEGLPAAERAVAASAAARRGFAGKWLIENTRSAVEPFLTHAERRDLRERVWRMFVNRGDSAGDRDNKPIITEILALRAERARLLGYPTHAHWAAERQMAKDPERALELMRGVWPAAVGMVQDELTAMRELAGSGRGGHHIERWDYRFFAEKVRNARAEVDWDVVKPYLQLDRLREGMFWVAGELFGLEFAPVEVPVYHPDVRAWRVTSRASGEHVGLFYFDPFARPGKKSGAWMNSYRRQERARESVTPIVSNNCNYVRAAPGEPVLISWTDAKTLFHEFGHALHGLLSDVEYPSLAGTSVPTDYVEFPSQLLEHWLSTPELLERFARHHETDEPLPSSLARKMEEAARLGRGFGTTEELASGFIDMHMHLAADHPLDPEAAEREVTDRIGLPKEMVMRHRPTHFSHIFSGDHYAAKYYSYLWADVLTADAVEAFREGGGMFDHDVAKRLRDCVLSRGNSRDPEIAYREFRGRDARVEALMRKRFGKSS